jgi:hypothetical protein
LATKPVLIIIMAGNYHFLATKIKKTQATKHSSSTCLKIPQYEKPFYKIVTFILIDFLFPSNSLLPHTDFSL